MPRSTWLFAACLALFPPAWAEEPARVVAVGDLHGDLDQALAALRLAGVVDDEGQWAGGDTVLVQTGDLTDRGPDSKALIDLVRRLDEQAQAAGGDVVPLLGNHEVMNLHGDWRYVHPGDVQAFGGVEARVEAFSLDGDYGGWLVEQSVTARVGETVFVHGGIAPAWAAHGLDGLDAIVQRALREGGGEVLGAEGPLWYRGFVADPEQQACPVLQRSLESLGARRMVVGHTTQRDGRIRTRCGGRLVVIDVGISSAYGGNLAALEIRGGDARALYPPGPTDLEDPAP